MPNDVPTNEVITLQRQGRTTEQITRELQSKGYSLQNIYEAMNQASIKMGVEGAPTPPGEEMQESMLDVPPPPTPQAPTVEAPPMPAPPQPSMPVYPQMQPQMMARPAMPAEPSVGYEEVQSLVEEVIDEKWKELIANIGDITSWRAQMNNEIESVKQELLRVEQRFDNMQSAVLGKVKEYGASMGDLGSEMKALEKVFEKIIEPLTTNIKELDRITGQLKGKKATNNSS